MDSWIINADYLVLNVKRESWESKYLLPRVSRVASHRMDG